MCLRLGRAVAPAFPRLRSEKPIACRRRDGGQKADRREFFSNEKVPPFPNNSLSLSYYHLATRPLPKR